MIASPSDITPDRTIHNPLQRDSATFLETVGESGGERTLLELEVAPGGGNEPHCHMTYAEHFEVLEGRLTVRLGGERLTLGPGEEATVPPRTVHCFANETDAPVRARVELRPGHRGMERALQAAYGLARDGHALPNGLPRNPLHAALLMEWSDIRFDGPARALNPVMGKLARVAVRRGMDADLEARYVRI